MESKQIFREVVNKETSHIINYTYNFCLYTVFCLYLNQQTAASNAWTFCVCTWRTHTNTQAYSVIHLAIQLSYLLVLLGLFLYLNHLCETVTFTQKQFRYSTNDISVYQCKSSACTLLWSFDVSESILFCFSSASLQGSVCIWLCIQIKDMPFTFHQRYGQLLSQKASST